MGESLLFCLSACLLFVFISLCVSVSFISGFLRSLALKVTLENCGYCCYFYSHYLATKVMASFWLFPSAVNPLKNNESLLKSQRAVRKHITLYILSEQSSAA